MFVTTITYTKPENTEFLTATNLSNDLLKSYAEFLNIRTNWPNVRRIVYDISSNTLVQTVFADTETTYQDLNTYLIANNSFAQEVVSYNSANTIVETVSTQELL